MNIELYAYLLLGLFFFVLWILCYVLRKDLRSLMLRVSVTGAVAGPLSELWYFKDYWLPPTIVGQGVLSPEDVLFGFAVFGVAAVAVPVITGRRLKVAHKPHPTVLFGFAFSSFFVGFLLFTNFLGINSILAASITMLLWAIVIVSMRRDLWKLSLSSGVLLAVLSVVIYVPLLNIATEYLRKYWFLSGQPLGLTVLGGVPVTEILWYFCLGSALSVIALYAEGKRQG